MTEACEEREGRDLRDVFFEGLSFSGRMTGGGRDGARGDADARSLKRETCDRKSGRIWCDLVRTRFVRLSSRTDVVKVSRAIC